MIRQICVRLLNTPDARALALISFLWSHSDLIVHRTVGNVC